MTDKKETPAAADAPAEIDFAAGLSRRAMLKGAGVAGAAVAGSLLAAGSAAAQDAPAAPAIANGAVEGMVYKAFIRRRGEPLLANVRLNALGPRSVLVRTEAACGCYTVNGQVLAGGGMGMTATIPNHSGFGTVVAVGAEVHRVRVGDRCLVSGTSQCGVCYQCLHGAPESCNYLAVSQGPIGTLVDEPDVNVTQSANIGGFAEYIVGLEEYCVPLFTDLPSEQLAMLGDTYGAGFAATTAYAPTTFGQDVVIFGAGPIGLAAVQGAHAHSAGQIIVIEPIPYRREKAVEFGATTVIDPNELWGNALTTRIRELCSGPSSRIDAGGRNPTGIFAPRGGDIVVECSGGDYMGLAPIVAGPDPTGIQAIVQSYNATRGGGSLVLMSGGHPPGANQVSFGATLFSLSTRRIYGGQMGGQHVLRDNPRIVKAAERGHIDIGAVITKRVPLTVEGMIDGFTGVASRAELGVVVMPQM